MMHGVNESPLQPRLIVAPANVFERSPIVTVVYIRVYIYGAILRTEQILEIVSQYLKLSLALSVE